MVRPAPPPANKSSRASRGVWSLLDQAASSLSNYALFIVVARTEGVRGLGAFSVSYTSYAIILSALRALSTDPLLVRYSNVRRRDLRTPAAMVTGFGGMAGALVGLALVSTGLLVRGPIGPPLVALGATLPLLMIQDACRFIFIAGKQPARAFVNDAVWLTVQIGALAALVSRGHPSTAVEVLAWGLSGGVAAGFGLFQLWQLPAPLKARRWFRSQRDLGMPFCGAVLVDRGSSQLGFNLVGAVGGLGSLGALTAARALFAPVTTVLSAASSVAVAEGTRLGGTRLTIRKYSWILSAVLAVLPLALAGVLYFGPQVLGRVLVGKSWLPAREALLPMAVFSAALAATLGPWTGLRVIQAANATFGVKLALAPVSLAAPVVGYLRGGVRGAAIGLAASGIVVVAVWAWVFERRMRERERPPVPAAEIVPAPIDLGIGLLSGIDQMPLALEDRSIREALDAGRIVIWPDEPDEPEAYRFVRRRTQDSRG